MPYKILVPRNFQELFLMTQIHGYLVPRSFQGMSPWSDRLGGSIGRVHLPFVRVLG